MGKPGLFHILHPGMSINTNILTYIHRYVKGLQCNMFGPPQEQGHSGMENGESLRKALPGTGHKFVLYSQPLKQTVENGEKYGIRCLYI